MNQASNYSKPLPDCKGPKLKPFKDRKATIDFRRLLSAGESEEGGHAHVFEVSIKSVVYALKVFKYYDHSADEGELLEKEKETITTGILQAHNDPFYCECRAYGRICEAGLNGKIAVHCYGFLVLPPAQETFFEERFQITSWNRPDDEYEKPIAQRTPFRATVKELITTNINFIQKNLSSMSRHLKHLAKLGIWPIDIVARNYKAGLLVDFSAAMTEPHYVFKTREPWAVESERREGFLAFDAMLEEAGYKLSNDRFMPNMEYTRKLRNPPEAPEANFLEKLYRRSEEQDFL